MWFNRRKIINLPLTGNSWGQRIEEQFKPQATRQHLALPVMKELKDERKPNDANCRWSASIGTPPSSSPLMVLIKCQSFWRKQGHWANKQGSLALVSN